MRHFLSKYLILTLTYVGILVVRHVGVHTVGEEGQGAVIPDGLPGEERGVQGPVHNPDRDPVLRVSLLQLTWQIFYLVSDNTTKCFRLRWSYGVS